MKRTEKVKPNGPEGNGMGLKPPEMEMGEILGNFGTQKEVFPEKEPPSGPSGKEFGMELTFDPRPEGGS